MSKNKNGLEFVLFYDFISSGNCFFAMKTYQGHRNIKMVDSYIEQKHLSDDIKSENTI